MTDFALTIASLQAADSEVLDRTPLDAKYPELDFVFNRVEDLEDELQSGKLQSEINELNDWLGNSNGALEEASVCIGTCVEMIETLCKMDKPDWRTMLADVADKLKCERDAIDNQISE